MYKMWHTADTNWDCSGGRKRERSIDSGRGQETRGGTSSFGAEKEVHDMAADHDVGKQ